MMMVMTDGVDLSKHASLGLYQDWGQILVLTPKTNSFFFLHYLELFKLLANEK